MLPAPKYLLSLAIVAASALAFASPAAAHPGHHHPGMPGATPLFDVPFPPAGAPAGGFSTDNVEFVKNIPAQFDAAGGRKVGDYFYITTERDLTIYDVREPANPVQVGYYVLELPGQPIYTEEDPDTNGRILLVSNAGTLLVIDVRDKTNPELLSSLDGADDHTVTCVLDCTWAYGSEGTIIDLRDPTRPRLSENNWQTDDIESEHDVTEVSPGMILTSTQPLKLIDARSNPEQPTVVASTAKEVDRFVHANLWPRGGQDDFLLVGGEAVGPDCSDSESATFSTWDAREWKETGAVRQIDEFRLEPGEVTDGRAPESSFCVHWFDEHPYYANGGLVSIGWYEHGTHFLKVGSDGQISEVGWYLGGGGQASAAYWIDERTVYVADYIRGLDVLRFTGDIGSPPAQAAATQPPAPPQQEQAQPPAPPAPTATPAPSCVRPAGLRDIGVKRLGRGLELEFDRTSPASVDVDVFRQAAGRRIVGDQLVARFKGRSDDVLWNGRANRAGRKVSDGYYFVRYRTRTADGPDVRRIALRRKDGRWSRRAGFYRQAACDLLRSFKLERPVFGGRSNRALGITYRVARDAQVRITVLRGRKVVKRFGARAAQAGRTYRVRLGADGLERGDYRVRIVAAGAAERVTASTLSRRL